MLRSTFTTLGRGPGAKLEECALNMVQNGQRKYAAAKDAQIMLRKEERASSMGQRSNDAAAKDAQIKL